MHGSAWPYTLLDMAKPRPGKGHGPLRLSTRKWSPSGATYFADRASSRQATLSALARFPDLKLVLACL